MKKIVTYKVKQTDIPCSVGWLLERRLGLTKAQIRSAKFRPSGIRVNGVQARVTGVLAEGDLLEVLLEQETDHGRDMEETEGSLDILYEDEDVILVNKAAGMPVHPGHGHFGDTLANQLLHYFHKQKKQVTIRAVGRLDKDTSGIVVFAKNKVAASRLSGNKVQKEYLALVKGQLKEKAGCIELPIGKKPGVLNQMEISDKGNFAKTHYEVEKEFSGYSCVRLWLDTGRTHQIRVHMAALGHPLLGDPIYGDGRKTNDCNTEANIRRAALHCARVELLQPFTGERIIREAPLPEDMGQYKKEEGAG